MIQWNRIFVCNSSWSLLPTSLGRKHTSTCARAGVGQQRAAKKRFLIQKFVYSIVWHSHTQWCRGEVNWFGRWRAGGWRQNSLLRQQNKCIDNGNLIAVGSSDFSVRSRWAPLLLANGSIKRTTKFFYGRLCSDSRTWLKMLDAKAIYKYIGEKLWDVFTWLSVTRPTQYVAVIAQASHCRLPHSAGCVCIPT